MTQASFYKDRNDQNQMGVVFEIPEKDLVKELHKRKQEEVNKSRQASKIINENEEIKDLKQKI